MAYSGMGRPSKIAELTKYQWGRINDGLICGAQHKFIAGAARISMATWYSWLKQARDHRNEGKTTVYTDFLDKIEEGESDYVLASLKKLDEAEKSHKGLEWILARRHRDEFHLSTKLEHAGRIDGDHAVTVFDGSALDQLGDVDDEEEGDE